MRRNPPIVGHHSRRTRFLNPTYLVLVARSGIVTFDKKIRDFLEEFVDDVNITLKG